MTAVSKQLTLMFLVGAFLLSWRARTDRDVAIAQSDNSIKVTRIYAGPDGVSHAETIDMETTRGVSGMITATGVQFSSRPPGPSSDWHTGPRRQFVITLSGRGELEVGDGQKIPVGPGHINLIEDTTGKGHITTNVGPDNRIVVTIPLADQTVGAALR
jgi:quercetin dioxygenase-like cupin family protein